MNALLFRLHRWRRARLARRIGLPAVLVTLLFLAALGFVAFRLGQRAVVEQVEARNRQLAVQVGTEVSSFFQNQLDNLRLQSDLLLADADPAAQAAALERLRLRFPYIYNDLRLYDAAGNLSLALDDGPANADQPAPSAGLPPDATLQQAIASGSIALSPVDFRPITGSPYLTMTLPLGSCAPEIAGCRPEALLLAQIDLRSFWTMVDSFQIEAGAVSIVDDRGIVLAHPERRLVGRPIDVTPFEPVFAGFEGVAGFNRDGSEFLAAYSPIGSPLNWGVIVEQERAEALALVQTIALAATLATLLSAVSLTLLTSGLVHRSLQPLTALSSTAGKIAESGDLDAAPLPAIAPEDAGTEIATLSQSFQQMLAGLRDAQHRLQQWNEDLEQRVAERTNQLQTVLEIARLSSTSLDEQTVLRTVLDQIERLIDYDQARVLLLTAGGEQLVPAAGSGRIVDALPVPPPQSDRALIRQVLREKQTCILADIAASPDWPTHYGPEPDSGSWLAVPLLAKDDTLGLLEVWHSRPAAFGAEDADVLAILAGQVAVTMAHARLYAESVQRVAHELQVASQVQQHLFPTRAPALPGLSIATFYRPAYETTGDFYAFVAGQATSDIGAEVTHTVDLIIGDVSGKSLPAALLMAMARTALFTAARTQEGDPVGALQRANTVLLGEMPRGSFVAGTYAHFNRNQRSLALVNAAQPAPLLVRHGTADLLEGSGDHWPLGIVPEPRYEPLHLDLQPGDMLLFYTDGLIEAFSPAGEMFGFERLQEILAACPANAGPHTIIEHVVAAGTAWIDGSLQHDDIAIVAVCITDEW